MDIIKYLTLIDLIDIYITKNISDIIKNKEEYEVIKNNIFLLGFINKIGKNSLEIL